MLLVMSDRRVRCGTHRHYNHGHENTGYGHPQGQTLPQLPPEDKPALREIEEVRACKMR